MGLPLTRYPFPVPEWQRTIWASAAARALWQPRLTQIGTAWAAVERSSVGLFRQAARQSIAPDQFAEFSRKAATTGRIAVALRKEASGASYQATPSQLAPGAPWAFQTALCASPAAAKSFLLAWETSDDQTIGELLGFPPCCIAFFRRTWVDEKWIDTTWPMAGPDIHGHGATVTGAPIEANILLRWIGVRWVPHLPCSFHCVGTQALGRKFRALMNETHSQEAAWIDELLDSPIEWSAWHGIAEIKHPLFKISAKTEATRERLSVRREGARYPEGAPTGNAFPYRRPKSEAPPAPLVFLRNKSSVHISKEMILSAHAEGRRLDEHADASAPLHTDCPTPDNAIPTTWTDNGFPTLEAQATAHDTIVNFYRTHVEPRHDLSVIDLGCGNARLASRLSKKSWGVESDRTRAARAKGARLVYHSTIEDYVATHDDAFAVAVLMPGRLLEMAADDASRVRAWLRTNAGKVLVYAYGDWLTKYPDGLLGLCVAAGVRLQSTPVSTAPGVCVGLLDMEAEW